MNLRIIGLSAKAGCGKTTLARELLALLGDGWVRTAFADVLKRDVAARFGIPLDWMYSEEGKARTVAITGQAAVINEPPRREMTVREILQWYGTDVCRASDPLWWVKRMREALEGLGTEVRGVIIDDVRFPDEVGVVHELGGIMVRLEPYAGWEPGPGADHASETALDGRGHMFDVTLRPGYGELGTAARQVAATLDLITAYRDEDSGRAA